MPQTSAGTSLSKVSLHVAGYFFFSSFKQQIVWSILNQIQFTCCCQLPLGTLLCQMFRWASTSLGPFHFLMTHKEGVRIRACENACCEWKRGLLLLSSLQVLGVARKEKHYHKKETVKKKTSFWRIQVLLSSRESLWYRTVITLERLIPSPVSSETCSVSCC